MSLELTPEQLQAAAQGPVHLTDPTTNATYVLLRAQDYEELVDDLDIDMHTVARLVDEVMAEDDAIHPAFETQQQHRKQP